MDREVSVAPSYRICQVSITKKHTIVLTNVWAHQVVKCLAYLDTMSEHKDASRHAEKSY